jgi:hypothetical protein
MGAEVLLMAFPPTWISFKRLNSRVPAAYFRSGAFSEAIERPQGLLAALGSPKWLEPV